MKCVTLKRGVLILALLIPLYGCGGGGGDEPSSGENPPGRDINGDETEKTHLNWSDDQTTWDQKNWS